MAKKIIKAQMKQRQDTKANWAAANPVLLDGELGMVSDDRNLYKVGDGRTAWNDLPFRGFDGTLAQELGTSANAAISQKAVTEKLTELSAKFGEYSGTYRGDVEIFNKDEVPSGNRIQVKLTLLVSKAMIAVKDSSGNIIHRFYAEGTIGDTISFDGYILPDNYETVANAGGYSGGINGGVYAEIKLNGMSIPKLKSEVEELHNAIYSQNYGNSAFANIGYITPQGDISSSAGFHYTDYIPVDNARLVHTENLEYGNQYIAVLVFYDAEKNFIKSISNVGDGLIEYDVEVPSNAAFIRATSTDKIASTSSVLIRLVSEESMTDTLLEDIESLQTEVEQIKSELSLQSSVIVNYGVDDSAWYDKWYEAKGFAQTYKCADTININAIVFCGLDLKDNASVEYRAYIVSTAPYNGFKISDSTHTLLASGFIEKKAEGYQDYTISLDDVRSIPNGRYLMVYIIGEQKSAIRYGSSHQIENEAEMIFALNPSWDGGWSLGVRYYVQTLNPMLYPSFVTRAEYDQDRKDIINEVANSVDPIVNAAFAKNLDIVIPPIVYAMEGIELNIWNDTISLSVDGGLMSPLNYRVMWYCSKGIITERGFRFTPSAADVGSVQCTCYLYDVRGMLVTSKTFTIKVVSASALQSAKKIAYFGDSLGAGAATALYQTLNSAAFKGVIPTMVGTIGTTNKYEAVGGYGWVNYATKGEECYRAYVSGVSSLSKGARYTDATGKAFEIAEINTTDGQGNILLYKYYSSGQYGYGDLQTPNGKLTKISGSGDATIAYTNAFKESTNPLWNSSLNKLDVAQFKTLCGMSASDKIDAVSFQFGINDDELADDITTLHSYIKALYDAFIADNPNCKVIVGLTTTSGNTLNGSGVNYGATFHNKTYQDRVYRIRKAYIDLLADSRFPNLRIASPHLSLDRYYGYALNTRAVSARCDVQEQYHTNYVHPAASGYAQMADAYIGAFIDALL